jgi:ABC-type branched-subunit amino acid transport system substrate-binding protein
MHSRLKHVPVLAAISAAAVLAACSSSGGTTTPSSSAGTGSSSSSSSSVPAPSYKGEVKIGIISDTSTVSAVGNPEPETVAAVQAHLDVINAAGGINGYKVVLDACDEKGDPNVAAACARKFVDEKVVADVGDISVFGPKYNPILQAAGIPHFGALAASAAEYTAPNSYPLSGGAVVMYQGAALDAAAKGAKSFYILGTEAEGSASLVGLIQPVVEKQGMSFKGSSLIPPGTADVSSYVTKAMNSGADVVLLTFGPDTTEQVLKTSVQLGAKYRVASAAESFSKEVIAAIGADKPIITSALLVTPYPPISETSIPAVSQYLREMDAYQSRGGKNAEDNVRSHVFAQWLAAYGFGQIAETVTGSLTAASFTQALNAAKDVDMLGAFPAWTPSKPGGILSRVSNGYGWYVHVVNGEQKLESTTPVDILTEAGTAPKG